MDIETKLKWLNFNSWYGLYPRRKSMREEYYNESFVKTVENTANTAIAAGRDVNEVIHDAIEVIYGRKSINELLPSGWIVVTHDCSACEYYQSPGLKPCYQCYNRFFDGLDDGPYTDKFKPKEKKEETVTVRPRCADCKYELFDANELPCRDCFQTDRRLSFIPIDRSVPPQNGKEE